MTRGGVTPEHTLAPRTGKGSDDECIDTHSESSDYPESDGQPIADNTLQFRWITVVQGNLAALFADRPDVSVAGDLLWYPVEGHPDIRRAPHVMVAMAARREIAARIYSGRKGDSRRRWCSRYGRRATLRAKWSTSTSSMSGTG
jgi:hypothetical protein